MNGTRSGFGGVNGARSVFGEEWVEQGVCLVRSEWDKEWVW